MNAGARPFVSTTLVGKVRLLVGDTDPTATDVEEVGEYLWYSDAEIEALLELFGSNPARVAAHIMRKVGTEEAMLLKKFSSADLTVDGPAIARTLQADAAALDRQADRWDEDNAAGGSFQLVPTGGLSVAALRATDAYDAETAAALTYLRGL